MYCLYVHCVCVSTACMYCVSVYQFLILHVSVYYITECHALSCHCECILFVIVFVSVLGHLSLCMSVCLSACPLTWTRPPSALARRPCPCVLHNCMSCCVTTMCVLFVILCQCVGSLYIRVFVSLSTDLDSTAECAGQKATLTESQGGSAHGNVGGVEHFLGPKIKHFHSFVYP